MLRQAWGTMCARGRSPGLLLSLQHTQSVPQITLNDRSTPSSLTPSTESFGGK